MNLANQRLGALAHLRSAGARHVFRSPCLGMLHQAETGLAVLQ
jgi:hypothetical protein